LEQLYGHDILKYPPTVFRKRAPQRGKTGIGKVNLFRVHDPASGREKELVVYDDKKCFLEIMKIVRDGAFAASIDVDDDQALLIPTRFLPLWRYLSRGRP